MAGGPVGGFAVHSGPCVADTPVAKFMRAAKTNRSGIDVCPLSDDAARLPVTQRTQKLQVLGGTLFLFPPGIGQSAGMSAVMAMAMGCDTSASMTGSTEVSTSSKASKGERITFLHRRPADSGKPLRMA